MAEVNVEKQRSEDSKGMERTSRGTGWPESSGFFGASPFTLMRRLQDEMERAFSTAWPGTGRGTEGGWLPAVDVTKHDGNLVVRADLPGINQDDVKVEVTDDGLVIQGERKSEYERETASGYRSERSYGKFYRCIPLPPEANVDNAHAQFKNGVLEVSIPVPEEQQRRREIRIEGASGEKKPASAEGSTRGKESKAG